MNIFNMTFTTLPEALIFFGFEPVTPIPACQQPTSPNALGFAATRSTYEVVGSRLFWLRDESLFLSHTPEGDGFNVLDDEKIQHISVVEGIDAEGFSTPILLQWNPYAEVYHRWQLPAGETRTRHSLDTDGAERVVVFVNTPDGEVFCKVGGLDDQMSIEALVSQLLNRA